MQLNAKDLQTFEAYKKAMKAAAGQIGNNTPFCIFSDVQMPDASKKVHTLRPFLVVGTAPSAITPLLKDLKGSKTLTGSGFCSLEGGKVSLVAKSGKVDYGQVKSQASMLRDLLGKEILIPSGDKPPATGPVSKLSTPAGDFPYSSNSKELESLKKDLEVLSKAQALEDQVDELLDHAAKLEKKIPPVNVIMQWVDKASGTTRSEAMSVKNAYQSIDGFKLVFQGILDDAKEAATSIHIAATHLKAAKDAKKGAELREQAEAEEKALDFITELASTALKLAVAPELEAAEWAEAAIEAGAASVKALHGNALLDQAKKLEDESRTLEVSAATEAFGLAKKHLVSLQTREAQWMPVLTRLRQVATVVGSIPMRDFDAQTKGPFHFKDIADLADDLTDIGNMTADIITIANEATVRLGTLLGMVKAKSWSLPMPDEAAQILTELKNSGIRMRDLASDRRKRASTDIGKWRKIYGDAQDGLMSSHGA
jgi:hypothetical protein